MMEFIDLKAQYSLLKKDIGTRIQKVLDHGQYIMGPEVYELEERLSNYVGAKHCISVSSGTDALLISLMSLGIRPCDEVITTPFTFAATSEVIALLGAKPVFVDVNPVTGNIDPQKIELAVNSKTRAIIPVSLYGQPADMDEINAIAEKHENIAVIEDAAQSFGAEYKSKKSCNLSKIACTSFFPSKPLGCYGDGGAIFTSDDTLAQVCREIRIHGQSKRYVHSRIGIGGRMDTIQCAIVLAKLDRFDWEVEQRLKIGNKYNELFDEYGIRHIQQSDDRTSIFAQYTVILPERERTRTELEREGIPTAIHYPIPLNEQPAYRDLCCPDCTPIASGLAKAVLSLPMGPYLDGVDQNKIANTLVSARQ